MNLGEDLQQSTPTSTNDKLTAMSSAIVRNCIANSTIDEIYKNRKKVREALKAGMLEVVKGWGIWVETIEILEVKVLSKSLFSDLQSQFMEEQKQKAELERLEIQNEMETQELKANVEMNEKRGNSDHKQKIYAANKELQIQTENAKIYIQKKKIEKEKYETEQNETLERRIKFNETQKKIDTNTLNYELAKKKNQITEKEAFLKVKQTEWQTEVLQAEHE